MNTMMISALMLVAAPVAAQQTCEQVRVRSPQSRIIDRVPTFSARTILDLDFQVVFPASFRGDHLVRVALTTPKGHLYQKLDVPVVDVLAAKRSRVIKGYPRPLPVRQLQVLEVDGVSKRVARVAFPVAGTSVIKSGLYGRWMVTVTLDDAKGACTTATFHLVE